MFRKGIILIQYFTKKIWGCIIFIFYPFYLSAETQKRPLVQVAANIFRNTCYEKRDSASAGIIVAGWDERHGGQVHYHTFLLKKQKYKLTPCVENILFILTII